MTDFISQFSTQLIVLGAVIAGGIALYGVFDKKARERRKDENKTEDRVIDLLQKEVGILSKRVEQQDKDIKELTKKVTALETENDTLVRVLQGRDDMTQKFYKDAYIAMENIKKTYDVAIGNNTHMTELIELMKKIVNNK